MNSSDLLHLLTLILQSTFIRIFIKDGHFDFPSRDWDHISGDAKDLITNLLVKDAKKRMSASDLMQHPWLLNNRVAELQTPERLRR